MAARKKSASKKTAAALKKPARAASQASQAKPKRKPVSTTAKMAAAKSARGGTAPASKAKAPGAAQAKGKPARTAKAAPRSTPKPGTVKGNTVDWYFDKAGGWQAEAMRRIHDIVVDTAEGVEHGIKWAQPVYEKYGPLAFLRSAKQHVTLGFWRGAEMIAPEGLLEGAGGRMKHLKIKSVTDIPGAVVDLVKQAVKLNEKKGDPTRKP